MKIESEYEVTIDHEGRMPIPDVCRARLRTGGFLTRSFNGISLTIYPAEIGKDITQRLTDPTQDTDPLTDQVVRYLSCGVTISLDAHGGIRVPSSLAQLAHLQQEVIVRDMGERLEVWNAGTWRQYRGKVVFDNFIERIDDCLVAS